MKLLFSLYRHHLLSLQPWTAFLFGLFLAIPYTYTDPAARLLYLFWTGPIHIVSFAWVAAAHVQGVLLRYLYLARRRRGARRADFFEQYRVARLEEWVISPHWIPFGEMFELCYAPNLLEPRLGTVGAGWRPSRCSLIDRGEFAACPALEAAKSAWIHSVPPERRNEDHRKYVLVDDPFSQTDEHILRLELRHTTWSYVQAALHATRSPATGRHWLFSATDPHWQRARKPKLTLSASRMPSSLCLHGIAVTSDYHLLAIKRPPPERTDYYPNHWSISFEEQLAQEDFEGRDQTDARSWLVRAVRQELLGNDVNKYFHRDAARLFAVGHEEAICNPFIVGYVPLTCTAAQLRRILPHAPDRKEWTEFAFYRVYPYDDLIKLFQQNDLLLHPTSLYRVYLLLTVLLYPLPVEDLVEGRPSPPTVLEQP